MTRFQSGDEQRRPNESPDRGQGDPNRESERFPGEDLGLDDQEVTFTPSQAEGERFPGREAGLNDQDVTFTPSQAEGDRETVERNLEEKDRDGYFDDRGREAG